MVKILLLIDYNKESERRLLNGLIRYADMRGGCEFFPMTSFDLESSGHSGQIIDAARKYGVDAIYGIWQDIDVDAALSLGIPIFIRMRYDEYDCFHMLSGPYREIGSMAARYFMRQHYDHYAFLGLRGIVWSDERFKGYRDTLHPGGGSLGEGSLSSGTLGSGTLGGGSLGSGTLSSGTLGGGTLGSGTLGGGSLGSGTLGGGSLGGGSLDAFFAAGAAEEWDLMSRWLEALPKPLALFACNDAMARRVTEICRFRGISVPDDVAVLGVDDDEFLCSFSSPSISSIKLDYEKQGEMLGQAIFSRVGKGALANAAPLRINIQPVGIVERRSTFSRPVQDPVVRGILDYFDDNYTTPFSLSEYLSTIPLSRRSIEMRFRRQMAPCTMLAYLTSLRVRKMCSLLSRGGVNVGEAAALSGFGDSTNVTRAFRSVTGITPREYLQNSRGSDPQSGPAR